MCSPVIVYDFTLHHIIYRKLLDEIYNLYSKNGKNGQKWRHYDVIMTSKLNFMKKVKTFSDSSSNFPEDRLIYIFSSSCYFLSNGAFYKKWRQNSENGQKWRHYDVIMTSKLHFKKKIIIFLDFSQKFRQDRWGHFFSYQINFLKYGQNPDFWHFPYISLINCL